MEVARRGDDPRALVPDYERLPKGIERSDGAYFIEAGAEWRGRLALRFAR